MHKPRQLCADVLERLHRTQRRTGQRTTVPLVSDRLWNCWMRAFARASRHPARPPSSRCPGCRQRGLQLVYTGEPGGIGWASMWCPACLTGITTCRSAVPTDAARTIPARLPPEDRATIIPDYVLAQQDDGDPAIVLWARNIVTGCAAALALTVVLAGVTAVLPIPGTRFLIGRVMPTIFVSMGAAQLVVRLIPWLLFEEHTFSDQPLGWAYRLRRRARTTLAIGGLLFAATLVVGMVLRVCNLPGGQVLMYGPLRAVFYIFGAAAALALLPRKRAKAPAPGAGGEALRSDSTESPS